MGENTTAIKVKTQLALASLFAVLGCACIEPRRELQLQPIGSSGRHTPSGRLEMMLDVKVDTFNNIQAAFATFEACLAGFPIGSSLTSAHLNSGTLESAGPILVDLGLEPGQVTFLDGTGSFTVTVPISPTLASQIISDTSAFYFQIDTALMPGALKGQFARVVVTYSSPDDNRVKRYRLPTSGDL